MTPKEFLNSENYKYREWVGCGSTHDDYKSAVEEYGKPQKVLRAGFMLALVYTDKIIVTGYDGNEYFHNFEFDD